MKELNKKTVIVTTKRAELTLIQSNFPSAEQCLQK